MHLPSPVTPEHIGHAVIRLREIEALSANGGKRGTALVKARVDQKRHIAELLEAFVDEGRRLNGRSVDAGSMPTDLGAVTGCY